MRINHIPIYVSIDDSSQNRVSTAPFFVFLMEQRMAFFFCFVLFGIVQGATNGQRMVKSEEELWRFQTGKNTEALSLGDAHICLLDFSNRFVAAREGQVYHDRDWCKQEERFRITLLSDNLVSIQSIASNQYVSCRLDGSANLQPSVDAWEKFELKIDNNDDNLFFYNPTHKKYLVARDGEGVRCDDDNGGSSTKFRGWKEGSKESWEPTDEGRDIQTFDNSQNSKVKTFSFKKTMGIKVLDNKEARLRVGESFDTSTGVKEAFTKNYKSPLRINWSKENQTVWSDAKTANTNWQVGPRTTVMLYQAVGMLGPIEVYSDRFFEVEE